MTRIIVLTVENVKRIEAVRLELKGGLVIIGGDNGAGKSSLLDAVMYAFAGLRAVPEQPVRQGARKAETVVELDNGLTITRTITAKGGGALVVTDNGVKQSSPQAILDKLTGALTFDPLGFMQFEPRKQMEQLKDIVGLDFEDMDGKRALLYDERTAINRDHAAARARLEQSPRFPDVPDEPVDTAKLMGDLKVAQEQNQQRQAVERELFETKRQAAQLKDQKADVDRQIIDLQELVAAVEHDRKEAETQIDNVESTLATIDPIDTAPIINQIERAAETNRQVAANFARLEIVRTVDVLKGTSGVLTDKIDEIDDSKARQLAEAKFPVDGLSFDADRVLYQGVPFDQASSAEQLRVSAAMAMACNPELRVMLIRDGSLLDATNLAMLNEIAEENDFQILLERVGDGDECSVIIEDGRVRSAGLTTSREAVAESAGA